MTRRTLGETEPPGGDRQEREEADHVGHRGDEHAGGDGGIELEAGERERHQYAAERRRRKVAQHGEADDHTEPGRPEPGRRRHSGDDGEGNAVDEADHQLAADEAPGVGLAKLARGEPPTMVMVCVVALPPWLATIGASTASATICCSSAWNSPSTDEARNAVARLTSSQLKRPRAIFHTGSESCSLACTPPSALMSASASRSITSTTSSTVSTPIRRPFSSTTGAATRS